MNVYETADEAYLGTLKDVLDNPEFLSSPRGQPVREKLNYQFTIKKPIIKPIETKDPVRNAVIQTYSDKEFIAYERGTGRVETFAKISKFWNSIQNPDGTINSDYGHLVFKKSSCGCDFEKELVESTHIKGVKEYKPVRRTPWEWAKMCLKEDSDTRQAILRFSLPEHQWKGNKDQTCTLHGIFMIRDNKLFLTINMRSNDLMLGLVYDLPWFISLMYKMKEELKDTYPSLEIGSYTHIVHNIHIYDRDLEKVQKMLGR